jgi:Ser/Thr protein kinase RdoA (MazF antagonist)
VGRVDITQLLEDRWGLTATRFEVLTGGMNSAAWSAAVDGRRVVLKSVDSGDSGFEPGLELAARLSDAGLITGRPLPSEAGRLVERVDGRQVGLLEFVDGEPLTTADAIAIGELLGRVHGISREPAGDLENWLRLVTQLDPWLDLEPWIRPAVESALRGVRRLGPLTWGWLHGDPAPEAFLRQSDGTVGLIDWGGAMHGPVLYDVASAVMYVDGPGVVVPAYLEERPELRGEVAAGLDAFLQVRYAVQAAYFAWRCSNDVRTGIADPAENRKGLDDARRAFGL